MDWQIEDGNKAFTNAALFKGGIILVLPTEDPKIDGALWNDNGILKISTSPAVGVE